MLNTADSNERQGWFNLHERYKTDFFEFYFFRKASGFMFLDGDKIELHDNCVLIIPPFKRQEWHVQMEELDYTFLIFQEEFIYNFISANILCTGCFSGSAEYNICISDAQYYEPHFYTPIVPLLSCNSATFTL